MKQTNSEAQERESKENVVDREGGSANGVVPDPERFCRKCAHSFMYVYYLQDGSFSWNSRNIRQEVRHCGHDLGRDVSGEETCTCRHQRSNRGVCGPEGRLFEPLPEPPK